VKLVAIVALLSACQRSSPITSCGDDLHGVYVTPAGQRWMVLDNGATLEAYPLFDDAVPDGAPRVIDVERATMTGEVKRRFMQRELACDARAPVHVTACSSAGLELVLADVSAPLAFSPCAWPQAQPARVERWRRDRSAL
jgi:hypothetical protein